MYTMPQLKGILYTTPSCFRGSTGSLGRTKCDLSVVSDLKTDRRHAVVGNDEAVQINL